MFKPFRQVRAAFALVNPEEVRSRATRSLAVGLVATGERGYRELENFLVPEGLSREIREAALKTVYRAGDRNAAPQVDLVLYEPGLPCPRGAFPLWRDEPQRTVNEILPEHEDFSLALARRFPPFRKTVVDQVVRLVSRENGLFAIATALPNIVPNLFELPWAFGEFASDTAFLTINQVRMAFLIAAASGAQVGFSKQKLEITSIVAGAFGWRAIARELAGKIPLGGGLIPKGAIAYAVTYVLGKGLERYHRAAVPFTPAEREEVYQQAYHQGTAVAESLSKDLGAT
jgi:uncharacterized protein (DUF697 family)